MKLQIIHLGKDPLHATKAYRTGRSIAPLMLKLSTR